MRYLKILLLHFEQSFEHRSRMFVWFLISLINPLTLMAYWFAYYKNINQSALTYITTYYLLMVIVGSLIMSHIEEDVAYDDIQQGNLSNYLLKPFSYPILKFCVETPWRIFQGLCGIIVLIIALIFFNKFLYISFSLQIFIFALLICMLGYIISFIFKMIIGFSAFWLVEYSGFRQFLDVLTLIFAGNLMPINLYPNSIQVIAYLLPFSYMIYFPIVSLQGRLNVIEMVKVLSVQIVWIFLLSLLYVFMWKKGIKKFSGMGD